MEIQRQSFSAELSVQGAAPKEATSTVYVSTNYMEVVTPRTAQTNLARYRRCSKKEYMDLATGELCTYSPHSIDGGENASDGTRGFRELNRILCTNFSGSNSELHITLTVASESQADLDSLQERFRKFWKSFRYRFPRCEYVVIAEPHKSGRYHLHLLVKDREGIPLYVKNEEVWRLWEIGVTSAVPRSTSAASSLLPKSPRRNRVSASCLSALPCVNLKSYRAYQTLERLKVGDRWVDTDRLFTQWNGEPIHPDTVTEWFAKFLKRHNLPKVTLHSLRHSNATLMIAEGVDIRTVSNRLGHAQTSTTLNIYSHALKSRDQDAAEKLDAALNF